MQAMDIEKYLAHLGQELTNLGMQEPVRVLMIRRGISEPFRLWHVPTSKSVLEKNPG